jgi:hypothetical protein
MLPVSPGPDSTLALVGIALFGLSVVVATGAGFVIFFRLRRPGSDTAARRVLVAAGVAGLAGLVLFAWAAARG